MSSLTLLPEEFDQRGGKCVVADTYHRPSLKVYARARIRDTYRVLRRAKGRGNERGGRVTIDLDAAKAFMAGHARALDRHRLSLLLGEGEAARPLAALDAYRNPDGGFGWGLEPDLRSMSSQPVGAMHAMEVFADP